jgi:para-nitrobenzyl esterase
MALSKFTRIHTSAIMLFLAACSTDKLSNSPSADSERLISQGSVVGYNGEYNNHAWIGIPFAKPPINDLRWKAPHKASAFVTKPFKATEHGSACTQLAGGLGGLEGELGTLGGSEDCLYLSIYAPKLTKEDMANNDKKLPVMVWVHGGANKVGAGSMYDGSRLAAEQNVIVVSINYRLGPFGWFLHPSLNNTGSDLDKSGNYGILDIIESLKWVKDNIASFGGNVNNVTLFGESAGAYNTLSLMLSPQAKGLFHKAISQSGGLTLTSSQAASNFVKDGGTEFSAQQVELYIHAVEQPEVNIEDVKFSLIATSDNDRSDFLKSLSPELIFNAYQYGDKSIGLRNPDLISDGIVIPKGDPAELFADANTHNNVSLIMGTNRDESKLYQFKDPNLVDIYFGAYFIVKDQNKYDAFAEYPSKMWKFNGVDKYAAALSKSMPGKVWAYRFDWDEQARPLGVKIDSLIGAGHGMEIPFVFGFTDKSYTFQQMYNKDNEESREVLSKRMRNYWAGFAHNGSPHRGLDRKGTKWNAWDKSDSNSDKYLILDSKLGGGIRMSNKIVSLNSIEKAVLSDTRIPDIKDKCRVFAKLAQAKDQHWPEEEYSSKVSGTCALFPLTSM